MQRSPDLALELRGLTKRYDDGTLALDALDLDVPAGSFFGLLGPNGAGKTTLISAVCNLIRPTEGELRVFGHSADCLEARRLVGVSEQEPNLDRFLSVYETLLYHGGYFGLERNEETAAARRYYEKVPRDLGDAVVFLLDPPGLHDAQVDGDDLDESVESLKAIIRAARSRT